MFTTVDSEGKPVKIASEVDGDGEHTLKVSGATSSGSGDTNAILSDILAELQTLNAALATANGHLATIVANTTQPIQTTSAS